MDDLAPAPTQRSSDDRGQESRETFMARKKATKRATVAPVKNPNPEPQPKPDPEPDHFLDVLA